MAILNLQRARPGTWIALVAMAVTGGGCMLLSRLSGGEKRFAFDHAIHVEEGLDCSDCHVGAEDSDEPGMPVLQQCLLCHVDLDAEKPPEKKVETLFVEGKFAAAHAARLAGDAIFSHARHVGAKLECAACHQGIETNRRIGLEVRVSMDACTACHADRGTANECATCHTEIREDRPPATHEQNWKRMHGRVVRAESAELADRCSLCHGESTCATCHQEEPPTSHNNFWRIRGHGIAAGMDRASCAVCHRSDSCEQCHAEVLPQSHVGMWGAPLDRHCFTCHFPLRDNGCAACHKDTPSHLTATPMPDWHDPGMNCRQCHSTTFGAGQPIPHVDNGSTCTTCHR